jgi:energy-coupling factor transport system ATP-binding protein
LDNHPYDLSGGEQQRVALCKVLLKSPEVILLDEPTKGFDAQFKKVFSEILFKLKEDGKTIIMVSHDIEFCAEVSDRCAMFFDGNITSLESTRKFFKNNTFYTTSANRMAKKIIPDAVLAEDIVLVCKNGR